MGKTERGRGGAGSGFLIPLSAAEALDGLGEGQKQRFSANNDEVSTIRGGYIEAGGAADPRWSQLSHLKEK